MNASDAALFLARMKAEFPMISPERGRSILDFLTDLRGEHAAAAFRIIVLNCDDKWGPTTKSIREAFAQAAHDAEMKAYVPGEPWTQERKQAEFVAAIPSLVAWRDAKKATKSLLADHLDKWIDGLVERVKRGEIPAPPSMAHLVTGFCPF